MKASVIEAGRQQLSVIRVLFAVQIHGQWQAQFQLRTWSEVVDRAQVDLRGDQCLGKFVDFEQVVAHAFIAQRNAAVDRIQLDFNLRQPLGIDLAVQHQKALHFGNIGVFGADERQPRRLAVQIPVGLGRQRSAGQQQ
ncbi:hypothetical protein D3C87_1578060 [compost metagenome]